MAELPSGTITFLYTDIEGSTARWEQQPQAMKAAVARHDALLRQAITAHQGQVFRTAGDGLCAAFTTAPDAVAAALAAQLAVQAEAWGEVGPLRMRMALHTGAVEVQDGDYVGAALNRIARLLAAGHGGLVLLSQTTADLVRGALPAGTSLGDLGEHRLRDLVEPERIYQVLHPDLPADFPPLRSLDAYPHNLPLQLTSFVGREQEMAEVKELLGKTRLLTLTGTGGCGKTRLALQIAAELVDQYADGVWLVELAPLADPDLVPQTVAAALGVREVPGQPVLTTLVNALRAKRLLLVLDNCEHLIDACAELVEALLRACPSLAILATSRELLSAAGEVAWRVPSLAVPDPRQATTAEQVSQCEAVRLFVERARQVQPALAVSEQNAPALAQICQRLDGIPLALELAAARVTALSVEQIAARLDNRFRLLTGGRRTALRRQQTLQAAIDWSYELLTEPERGLLRRLAVFAGGWTLEAAEQVCAGAGVEAWEVLDLLTRLVEKSLVVAEEQAGAERYRLLETVRQYAADKLLAAGEAAAVRDRHRDWYLALAVQAEPGLLGPDQLVSLARLDTEQDNLRTALAWCLETDPNAGLRQAGSLWRYWRARGLLTEGRRWLAAVLTQTPETAPARTKALAGAGTLAREQGDYAAARLMQEQSRALFQAGGDQGGEAFVVRELGGTLIRQGELTHAQRLLEEGLALAHAAGDRRGLGCCRFVLAANLAQQGDYGRARSLAEASVADLRAVGDRWNLAIALRTLGLVLADQGDVTPARAAGEESLALCQTLGDRFAVVWTLQLLGQLAHRVGDDEEAARLLEQALSICEANGERGGISAETLGMLGRVAWRRREGARAVRLLRDGLARSREAQAPLTSAECLEGLAGVALGTGQPKRAARLLGAAAAVRAAIGAPLPPVERADHEATVQAVRAALGEEPFAAVWAAGQALSLEEAVAEALAEGADG